MVRLLLISGVLTLILMACSSSPDPTLVAAGEDKTDLVGDPDQSEVLRITPTVPTTAPQASTTTIDPAQIEVRQSSTNDIPLVIYDTDMGPDVDDVLALAMLHSYQKQGRIELAAVTVSRKSEAGARYSDAINTFYGRPDIPIGMYYGGTEAFFDDRQNYVSTVDSWESDVGDNPITEGYKVQRKVLADALATNREVIIIQTGFSGNVSDLLVSQGDEISNLDGRQLAEQTVSLLSIMAGAIELNIVEFNIEKDVQSAREVFDLWPGRLALSPFELGNAIHYPYWSIAKDYNWVDRHPVKEAYEFKDLEWHKDAPPYYDMRSWDLTSVIEAIEPEANYFLRSEVGTVRVDGSGRTSFAPGQGRHYVLDRAKQYSGEQRERIINRMIELTSDRP